MSALPKFTIKELMDSGVHFGHKTMRWNPKMQQFIFGARNNIHIIDLQKTAPLLNRALTIASQVASKNGRILFVATKKQASAIVAEAAERCGQYYVNHRWMGGMLTNWETVSKSIKTLNDIEKQLEDPESSLVKKEKLQLRRKADKLELALGGIRRMGGKPDLIVVIDTNRERIAIKEANTLHIPTIAVVDTNSDPEDIDYIVPGNDDSIKSIRLFCNLFADAILAGIQKSVSGDVAEKPANNDSAEEGKEKPVKKVEKKTTKKASPNKKAEEEAKTEEQKENVKEEAKEEKPKAKTPAKKKADAEKKEAKKPADKVGSKEEKPKAKAPAKKKAAAKKAEEKK
jgi:small subunit ribosomal protein S2